MSNTSRPVIAINCDFFDAGKNHSAHARVNAGYFDAVLHVGGLPILLPPINKDIEIEAILSRVDGVIMTGGKDMDPRRFGQKAPDTIQPMAERRELSDRILMQRVLERKLPLLAVGLGMQQLNVMCGGTMYHHLPIDLPKAMAHFSTSFGETHRHMVKVEKDSRVYKAYGAEEVRVSSQHHQAIKTVGRNLRAVAQGFDEVVEAIESTDPNWFCLGVQWHPESESNTALDIRLFDEFVKAARGVPVEETLKLRPAPAASGTRKMAKAG